MKLRDHVARLREQLVKDRAFGLAPDYLAERAIVLLEEVFVLFPVAAEADRAEDHDDGLDSLVGQRVRVSNDGEVTLTGYAADHEPLEVAPHDDSDGAVLRRIEARLEALFPGRFEGGGRWRQLRFVPSREAGITASR